MYPRIFFSIPKEPTTARNDRSAVRRIIGTRDAVGADEVLDVDVRDPAVLLDELELVHHIHAGQGPVIDVEHPDREASGG